jgi:hypothetical protein
MCFLMMIRHPRIHLVSRDLSARNAFSFVIGWMTTASVFLIEVITTSYRDELFAIP